MLLEVDAFGWVSLHELGRLWCTCGRFSKLHTTIKKKNDCFWLCLGGRKFSFAVAVHFCSDALRAARVDVVCKNAGMIVHSYCRGR